VGERPVEPRPVGGQRRRDRHVTAERIGPPRVHGEQDNV
jgi:hypothetical protein